MKGGYALQQVHARTSPSFHTVQRRLLARKSLVPFKHEGGLADGYGLPIALVLLHVGDQDVPDPLRDLKFFDINEFPGYVRHLAALARKR
jgi:hypothetical protein